MTRAPEDIRRTIREALKTQGMSLNQLARASGIDVAHISRYVNSKKNTTLKGIDSMADALGLRITLVPKTSKGKTKKGR
jgi:transcriptional regulator with XRE-family HTH domain